MRAFGLSALGAGLLALGVYILTYQSPQMSESVVMYKTRNLNVCGDGNVADAEACDDGNIAASDGCSATCTVEAGYACTGSPSICSDDPTLLALLSSSGLSGLSKTLTINGVTVTPSVWCEGQAATATDWACDYGGTLSIAGSGADPTLDVAAPFSDGTGSVFLPDNAGKRYEMAASATGDIATEDIVFESVFQCGANSGTHLGKLTADGVGWLSGISANRFRVIVGDADSYVGTTSPLCTNGSWYHGICFVNRDEASTNGSVCYLNAVAYTGVDQTAQQGSLTNAIVVAVNSNGGGRDVGEVAAKLASASMWKYTSWHKSGADGPAEWAVIAKNRFAALTGTWASTPGASPTFTQATTSTLGIYDATTSATTLHTVGAGWPRASCLVDGSNDRQCGLLVEQAATNLALQSQTFGTTWALTDAGDSISTNGATSPDGTSNADGFIPDSTNGTHAIGQAETTTATAWAMSVFVKAGTHSWTRIQDSYGGGLAYIDVDVAACSVGAAGANASAYGAISYGGGWCRVWLRRTGRADVNQFYIYVMDGAGDYTVSGNGSSVALWLYQSQDEIGSYPSSPIITTTDAVTRNADVLYYSKAAPAAGSLYLSVLCPNRDLAADVAFATYSDGTADNRITLQGLAAGDVAKLVITTGTTEQAAVTGTTDLYDGALHTLRAVWDSSGAALYVDGASEGTPDTNGVTVPTTTRLYLASGTGTLQSGCIIAPLKEYDEVVAP